MLLIISLILYELPSLTIIVLGHAHMIFFFFNSIESFVINMFFGRKLLKSEFKYFENLIFFFFRILLMNKLQQGQFCSSILICVMQFKCFLISDPMITLFAKITILKNASISRSMIDDRFERKKKKNKYFFSHDYRTLMTQNVVRATRNESKKTLNASKTRFNLNGNAFHLRFERL